MRLLPLLPLTVLLAGCDQAKAFLPDVSFDRLDVNTVDWSSIDTDFVFQVQNPNPVEISLARFSYELSFVDGDGLTHSWATGDDADGFDLLAADASEFALPVALEFQTLYETVQAMRGSDGVDFGLTGSFGFDTPMGVVDLPYDASGLFPALRTPAVTFNKVQVDSIDLVGAVVDVKLDIDNDHASNLLFNNFDYNLRLEGNDVASGLVEAFADVEGANTKTVSIPVELDWIEAGTGLYDALTGGDNINAGIEAATDVETPFGVVPLSIDESGAVTLDY